MTNNELRKKIIARINSTFKGAACCPMCGGKSFDATNGFVTLVIQKNLKDIQLDGNFLPAIPIVCKQCGFISLQSLNADEIKELLEEESQE